MKLEIPVDSMKVAMHDTIYSYDSKLTDFSYFEFSQINKLQSIAQKLTGYLQYNSYGISQSFNEEIFFRAPRSNDREIVSDPYRQSGNFEFNDMTVAVIYEGNHIFKFYGNDGELKYAVTYPIGAVSAVYTHLGCNLNYIHIHIDYIQINGSKFRKILSINPYTATILQHTIYNSYLIDASNNSVYSAYMKYYGANDNRVTFQTFDMNLSSMSTYSHDVASKQVKVSNVAFYHTHLELEALSNDVNLSVATNENVLSSFKYSEFVPEIIPSSKIYVFLIDDRNSGLGGDYVIFDLNSKFITNSNVVVTYAGQYYLDEANTIQYYNDTEANIELIDNDTLIQYNNSKWLPFIANNNIYFASLTHMLAFKKYKDLDLGHDYTSVLDGLVSHFVVDPLYKLIYSKSAINIWDKYSSNFSKITLRGSSGVLFSINTKYRNLSAYHSNRIDSYDVEHLFTTDDILKINPIGDVEGFLLFTDKIKKYMFSLDYLGHISKGNVKNYILLLKVEKILAYLKDGITISVTKPDASIVEWSYVPVPIDENGYRMICQITIFGFGNIHLETIPYTIDEYMLNNDLTYSVVL